MKIKKGDRVRVYQKDKQISGTVMINQERLKKVKAFVLCTGIGDVEKNSLCIMQAVDYVTSGGTSDHPECTCPILTEYAIKLNDKFNKDHRQRLKPFITLLAGTVGSDTVRIARKRLFMWRNVTVTYPLILDILKLPQLAEQLRLFNNTPQDMAKAYEFLQAHKKQIKDANSNSSVYANAYANAYADANSSAYANSYANANSSGDASVYAYADASVYAGAYALREKLADMALETLRMAIEVKE